MFKKKNKTKKTYTKFQFSLRKSDMRVLKENATERKNNKADIP